MGGIKKDNLNEIRSLKMPPEQIRDVLEGVLKIMGNFDTTCISMMRFTTRTPLTHAHQDLPPPLVTGGSR